MRSTMTHAPNGYLGARPDIHAFAAGIGHGKDGLPHGKRGEQHGNGPAFCNPDHSGREKGHHKGNDALE